jgi:hypothetical protein
MAAFAVDLGGQLATGVATNVESVTAPTVLAGNSVAHHS